MSLVRVSPHGRRIMTVALEDHAMDSGLGGPEGSRWHGTGAPNRFGVAPMA